MLGKLPFVLGYGVYCQNGGSEKIFFQFLTSCKKCLDAGKDVTFSLRAYLHEFPLSRKDRHHTTIQNPLLL